MHQGDPSTKSVCIRGITITEAYRKYSPPISALGVVKRLIGGVPEKYVSGIHDIVLTDAGGLSHSRRRSKTRSRKRKVAIKGCLGLYHARSGSEPAWIELFVDNILENAPRWVLFLPLMRDAIFGQTLFHEVGHHLHATWAPQHREKEDVADEWERKLTSSYLRRKYWYLSCCLIPLRLCAGWTFSRLDAVYRRR